MIHERRFVSVQLAFSGLLVAAATLSGCGGSGRETDPTQPSGNANAADYAATMEYCGSMEPSGNSTQPGGWDITFPHHNSAPLFDVNALVSVGGANGSASLSPSLMVDINDYRGVTGKFIPSAYVEPDWKMGVKFVPAFAPKSAACVAGLAKLVSASTPAPGAYTLLWRSRWSAAVPVERLPGTIVDGFEFVSNFAPKGAQVFFILSKKRQANVQGASVCYLAPAGSQWDCAAATVFDRGRDWQLSRPRNQPGVYVVVMPQ